MTNFSSSYAKLKIIIWVSSLFLPASVCARNVQGVLGKHVTWEGEIHIIGDVLVPSNGFLTIFARNHG